MQSLPVPHPTGGTLLDWATSFLDAGDDIDKLLNDRSLVSNESLSTPALKIRSTTIGILSLDQLQATREEAAVRRNKGDKKDGQDTTQAPPAENTGG